MRQAQRVAAYGVCRTSRDSGGVVLVRLSPRSDLAGLWSLPGGGVDHGEDPAAAVVREFAEETGLTVAVTGLRDVVDDVLDLPYRGLQVHTVRLVYDVRDVGGSLRPESGGSSDAVSVIPLDDTDDLPLTPFTARLLGLSRPGPALPRQPVDPMPAAPATGEGPGGAARVRRQRVAVYGLISDLDHVLLARQSGSAPSPGMWTLPGGGIDHGEPVRAALAREVWEETGLRLRESTLLSASSTRFLGTSPDGVEEDYHGVPVVFRGTVEPDPDGGLATPVVMETGGTTDAAAWVPLHAVPDFRLSGSAAEAVALLRAGEYRAV